MPKQLTPHLGLVIGNDNDAARVADDILANFDLIDAFATEVLTILQGVPANATALALEVETRVSALQQANAAIAAEINARQAAMTASANALAAEMEARQAVETRVGVVEAKLPSYVTALTDPQASRPSGAVSVHWICSTLPVNLGPNDFWTDNS